MPPPTRSVQALPTDSRTGSSPLIRIPDGPCSSASVFTTPARPGKSPLEIASSGSGARTEATSTKAMDPPVPLREPVGEPSSRSPARPDARTRASRTAPRKTVSNADRHASSAVAATVPPGDPPTLISAPSRRPKRSLAAVISWPGAAGSALSATAQATAPGAASCVRRAAAAAAVVSCGALSSTRAPSATSAWAAANPRPRLPPVTRYTLSRNPRSIRPFCPGRRLAGGQPAVRRCAAPHGPAAVAASAHDSQRNSPCLSIAKAGTWTSRFFARRPRVCAYVDRDVLV
jgi:hypothetical protein